MLCRPQLANKRFGLRVNDDEHALNIRHVKFIPLEEMRVGLTYTILLGKFLRKQFLCLISYRIK